MNEFMRDESFRNLKTAFRAGREIDRIKGLLRFSPNADGVFIARCAPDHYILPALAEHFTLRFGDEPWAIIDEARGLALMRPRGQGARVCPFDPLHPWFSGEAAAASGGQWEELWKTYHRSVANESRANAGLQKQFMPARYWKYLPEMK
jgi:probable DNA metabolism protein